MSEEPTHDHGDTNSGSPGPLYLASGSPRRRELLAQMGVPHIPVKQRVDESVLQGEEPGDYVLRLAAAKAAAGLRALPEGRRGLVLGADTAVVCEGRILGKPAGRDEALQMLGLLSGRRHQVLSAVALADGRREAASLCVTEVEFRHLSEREINAYWGTGEASDKAGAYGIQGLGGMFVKRIEGSYTAVVGLPVHETTELLSRFGWSLENILKGADS